MSRILVTGGTGFIGERLLPLLVEKGHEVVVVTRNPSKVTRYEAVAWDPAKGYLHESAMDGIDVIAHLAGEGIADKKWTPERKKAIIESRSETANLLLDHVKKSANPPAMMLAASAIGIYGAVTTDQVFTEEDPAHPEFLGQSVRIWEDATNQFRDAGMTTFQLRIGVVLGPGGGALPKMATPVKFGAGAPLGHGRQNIPWVHREDICRMFLWGLENRIDGVYNGVAPQAVTNKEFNKVLAKVLRRPLFLPNVPAAVIKGVFGELAQLVLEGSAVSAEKIRKAGYQFQYPDLEGALRQIYKRD